MLLLLISFQLLFTVVFLLFNACLLLFVISVCFVVFLCNAVVVAFCCSHVLIVLGIFCFIMVNNII